MISYDSITSKKGANIDIGTFFHFPFVPAYVIIAQEHSLK